jgi:hypothetical protein
MPRLIGLMLARNSEWVLGASARAALLYCDGLVIFDHASSDGTAALALDIGDEYPGRVALLREASPEWREMEHRQATLELARSMEATHVLNVDDDEILTANLIGSIREHVAAVQPGEALDLPWISMWGGIDTYRDDDSHWSRSQVDFAFADIEGMRYHAAADGYQHHARRPRGCAGRTHVPVVAQRLGGLMHLQFSSELRLKAKQYLYQMNEVLRWPGRKSPEAIRKMYDGTTLDVPRRTVAVPAEWWAGMEHLRQHIHLDAEPWQLAEVRRLLLEHGPETFAGLNSYGLA